MSKMGEEERDNLSGDGAEVAVPANAGDPLKWRRRRDGVRRIGVEGRADRNAGGWVASWHAGGCRIEECVEAAGFGGRGEGSGIGKHVLRGGDDGVGARGGDFDP